MNYFRGLFKERRGSSRGVSPSHGHHRPHHKDASAHSDEAPEANSHRFEEIPAEQLAPREENLPSPSATTSDKGTQERTVENYTSVPVTPPQRAPSPPGRLQPAYRYTCGEFSEAISREEALLAHQYNFAGSSDRVRAEATSSATRRNVNDPPNGEFDSIFTQFMHETVDR
ncbi:hypothetical protein NESM_000123400 [Novymonas esmeraldas]|uniref:Uncharacterized protein n=1 Tax=Novymonas esmeraldas TaxID=1808958 RepID=A0AAW0F628_9TRYP